MESGGRNDTECGIIVYVATDKIIQKMRARHIGWRMEDLQAVAAAYSVERRRPGHGGSHVIFSAQGVRDIVSVPANRPVKPVYNLAVLGVDRRRGR